MNKINTLLIGKKNYINNSIYSYLIDRSIEVDFQINSDNLSNWQKNVNCYICNDSATNDINAIIMGYVDREEKYSSNILRQHMIEYCLIPGVIAYLSSMLPYKKRKIIILSSEIVNKFKPNEKEIELISLVLHQFKRYIKSEISKTTINGFVANVLSLITIESQVNYYAVIILLREILICDSVEMDTIICRASNIYGRDINPNNSITTSINARINGNMMEIENKCSNYLYIDDLNEGIFSAISSPMPNRVNIFDFSSSIQINTVEIINIIISALPTMYGEFIFKNQDCSENDCCSENHFKDDCRNTKIERLDKLLLRKPTTILNGIKNTIFYLQSINQSNMNFDSNKLAVRDDELLVREIHNGGSSGHVLLVEDKKSTIQFIRKIAIRNGVEGNGIPKLLKEILYLTQINNNLAELYPRILNSQTSGNAISYDMTYCGTNLTEMINTSMSVPQFLKVFEELINTIVVNGYNINRLSLSKDESLSLFESMYTLRGKARMAHVIKPAADHGYDFTSPSIKINGINYKNPLSILTKIESSANLNDLFRPRTTSCCTHGDLTLLNMVYNFENNKIMLIDPRGLVGNLDPMYDFGKMKFSMSGFADIINGHYTFSYSNANNSYMIVNNNPKKGRYEQINNQFFDILFGNSHFEQFVEIEENWKERILLYEAIHYLADIPFRLYTDAVTENSFICFLIGTILLNKIDSKIISNYI